MIVDRPDVECTRCKQPTHWLATFPGGICLDCYEVKMAGVPLEVLRQQIVAGFSLDRQ